MSPSKISPATLEKLTDLRTRWEKLTYRQQEIALLVMGENLTNKQIAQRLSLSRHTVKDHLSAVYARLGVRGRRRLRRLMIYAARHGELLDE